MLGLVEPAIADLPGLIRIMLLTDAANHEHDIRGALGQAGARDSDVINFAFNGVAPALGAQQGELGALRIVHDAGEMVIGEGDPTATLTTTRFEVVRAAVGRRSPDQIAGVELGRSTPPRGDGVLDVRPRSQRTPGRIARRGTPQMIVRHRRSIGATCMRSSNVYERAPVLKATPAMKRSPKESRSLRNPRRSFPAIRSLAFTSNDTTPPSSNSMTRSTSSSSTRQCPRVSGSSSQEACFRSSPTTNDSSR